MYRLKDYSYELPAGRIAQRPAVQRDTSQLLVLGRKTGRMTHRRFGALGDLLAAGDVLVVNDSAVVPGRLQGKKETGGRVEVLIADFASGRTASGDGRHFVCDCLVKAAKRPRPGSRFYFDEGLQAEVIASHNATHTLRFNAGDNFETLLERIGRVPLPPYIRRPAADPTPCNDRACYQTVYAAPKGSVAAPTAGLHFTRPLLDSLRKRGVQIAALTLHVGYGTFQPVRTADIRRHKMHAERFCIPPETAAAVNAARRKGRRIVAVGTTCVRTLEYASDAGGQVAAGRGNCDLFIYPGFQFKVVDALVTNFHLPRSTLLMLVAAFAGRRNILHAYGEAVKRGYRFYSYGDAMLII